MRCSAFDEPRRAAEAELQILRLLCFDIDVVICVIAHRMASRDNFAQPVDILLFEHTSDHKKVQRAPRLFHAPGCFDRVAFCFLVEVSFFKVPMDLILRRILSAHFEIERDGDHGAFHRTGFAFIRVRCRCRAARQAEHRGKSRRLLEQ